jgi:exoribonuclease R
MKKFLVILGAIFLALILLAVAFFVRSAIEGTKLDNESKAYVDQAIPAIVSSWNEQELWSRISPEFQRATRFSDVEQFFQSLKKLGKLKEHKGSQGQAVISRILGKGTTISANYVIEAEFEAGSAKIFVRLIKYGDQWEIASFRVEPSFQIPPTHAMLQNGSTSIQS